MKLENKYGLSNKIYYESIKSGIDILGKYQSKMQLNSMSFPCANYKTRCHNTTQSRFLYKEWKALVRTGALESVAVAGALHRAYFLSQECTGAAVSCWNYTAK